jgi:hypothetical protein
MQLDDTYSKPNVPNEYSRLVSYMIPARSLFETDNNILSQIESFKDLIKNFIAFQSKSSIYNIENESDFEKILKETDVLKCLDEVIVATDFRNGIEQTIIAFDRLFNNINEYQQLYLSLKNHYISLNVDSNYTEEDISPEEDELVKTELKIKPEVLPDDINVYGSEYLKGK